MNYKLKQSEERNDIVCWMSAFVLSFQYICAVLSFNGISLFLSGILIVLSVYLICIHKFHLYFSFVITFFFVLISFGISFTRVPETSSTIDYFERFLIYDLVALVIGMQAVSKDRVIKNIITIGILGLPIILLKNLSDMNTSNLMGFSYSCMPILLASIIGAILLNKYRIVSIINIVGILYKYITIAPRGVWVLLLSFVALIVYYKLSVNKEGKGNRVRSTIILAIFTIVFAYMISNLEAVIYYINSFLNTHFNIKVYALDKYLRYLAQEKLYNGRDDLWLTAKQLMRSNPVFGHGIGYFEFYNQSGHSHNLIYQAICEAGIFFIIPLGYVIIKTVIRTMSIPRKSDIIEFFWLCLAITLGYEILSFSSTYWLYIPFWYFLGGFMASNSRIGSIRINGDGL